MKVVLTGGPYNNEWRDVAEAGDELRLHVRPDTSVAITEPSDQAPAHQVAVYRRQRLSPEDRTRLLQQGYDALYRYEASQ